MEDLVAFLRDCYDEETAELERLTSGAFVQGYLRVHGDRLKADIEVKRRIIEIHKLEVAKDPARFNQLTGEQLPDVYEVDCAVCGWATDDPTSGCETLRLLALPCVDRPGYREKWKP
ncbi:DUF6221 family protein [Streptosporangium sp. NPDC004631]